MMCGAIERTAIKFYAGTRLPARRVTRTVACDQNSTCHRERRVEADVGDGIANNFVDFQQASSCMGARQMKPWATAAHRLTTRKRRGRPEGCCAAMQFDEWLLAAGVPYDQWRMVSAGIVLLPRSAPTI